METVDVLVAGAGLAGLHTARLLARQGFDVLVVDRRRSLDTGIRTTGIFVRRTLDDFALPGRHLGPPIRRVVLHPPSGRRPVELLSARDEFRVADMAGVYADARARAEQAGARVRLGVPYPVADVTARFTIGADGARSTVARRLGLDVNRHLIVGIEEVYPMAAGDGPPTFHCVIDPRLAPGYLGWVVDDGRHAHVGLAGRPDRLAAPLPQLLHAFRDRFSTGPDGPDGGGSGRFGAGPDGGGSGRFGAGSDGRGAGWGGDADGPGGGSGVLPVAEGPVRRRGGPIPVGGLLRRIACPDGLLVGDAAGAVSPLTAGGLDPCLRLSRLAAEVTGDYLRSGDASVLRHYDGAGLRARFRGRLLMRRALSGLRSAAGAEAAFTLLHTAPGRAAAARVLFGDGSFPDPPLRRSVPGAASTTP
ncbi:FAD-dependent oxidoreductase [Pseudosporangium ferrugineum]|uniref:Flavin-dependent dehydrogenase n=1 Tax=Pseudosporangium ferrugineum TaxID=439699 RepID=A0A2T0SDB9_9ACTN|nr:NAD(P)/FAD-dependent oxidoreductase [Pseudosporangium ferrugineum]PRY31414.1 flavin-dependent dehydrogenase [Pseudosporangium ferrugineum]